MTTSQKRGETAENGSGIKRILIPTDFSEYAHNAFIYALSLAERLQAEIVLLHSYQDTPAQTEYMPRFLVDALREEKIGRATEQFESYLLEAKQGVGEDISVEVILEPGRVANVICKISEEKQIDLIIMGTRGAASPFEQIRGSVTAEVIQKTKMPVLAIPAESTFQPVRNIMYAMGIEDADFPIINRLQDLATALEAKLICTHIKRNNDTWARLDLKLLHEIYQLEKEGSIEFFVTQFDDVLHGLHKFVTENQVDWLVMTTHPSSRINHLFDESLTRQMVLYTDVPLLAYHSQ